MAAASGYTELFTMLLDKGARADQTTYSVEDSLFLAAQNGHYEIVKLLLERKDINPYQLNMHGLTAYDAALANGHRFMAHLFESFYSSNHDEKEMNDANLNAEGFSGLLGDESKKEL